MDPIYEAATRNIANYMYPKTNTILDIIREEPKTEAPETPADDVQEVTIDAESEVTSTVAEEDDATYTVADPDTTQEVATTGTMTREEASALKKLELVGAIKLMFGDEADVSGTKTELLDRFFPAE